ncbi:Uncharacterized protein EJ110_NYTH25804 [Nymphaea thermarum]|nr:Uncharacterized protein EJ110_NYTH25804 [Nymphaea thermarum]
MMLNKCIARYSRAAYMVRGSCLSFSGRPYSVAGEDGSCTVLHQGLSDTATPCLLQPGVVVYDGVCHLCNKGVNWVIRADKYKKIKFCAVQSRAAEPYLNFSGVAREAVLRRFLFVEGPGLCHQGSTAALKVLSYLPLPYSVLSLLLVIPAPLRDGVYDYIANRRYQWFGKEDDCIIPNEEVLDRFIDRHEIFERLRKSS